MVLLLLSISQSVTAVMYNENDSTELEKSFYVGVFYSYFTAENFPIIHKLKPKGSLKFSLPLKLKKMILKNSLNNIVKNFITI